MCKWMAFDLLAIQGRSRSGDHQAGLRAYCAANSMVYFLKFANWVRVTREQKLTLVSEQVELTDFDYGGVDRLVYEKNDVVIRFYPVIRPDDGSVICKLEPTGLRHRLFSRPVVHDSRTANARRAVQWSGASPCAWQPANRSLTLSSVDNLHHGSAKPVEAKNPIRRVSRSAQFGSHRQRRGSSSGRTRDTSYAVDGRSSCRAGSPHPRKKTRRYVATPTSPFGHSQNASGTARSAIEAFPDRTTATGSPRGNGSRFRHRRLRSGQACAAPRSAGARITQIARAQSERKLKHDPAFRAGKARLKFEHANDHVEDALGDADCLDGSFLPMLGLDQHLWQKPDEPVILWHRFM